MKDYSHELDALVARRTVTQKYYTHQHTVAPAAPIAPLRFQKIPDKKFVFPPELRQYHLQTLGRPGGGKTKFLEACIRQDILNEHGLVLFDPTGNFYNDVVKWLVQEGLVDKRDVILLNPSNYQRTFTFNPLEVRKIPGESERHRQIRITNVVDATMRAIGSIQGGEDPENLPRYNYVMRNILHALAENGKTLTDAHLFTEKSNQSERSTLINRCQSQAVRQALFSLHNRDKKDFELFMEAPVNRMARFQSASLSCVVGHPTSSFDFREVMDRGQILLINLGTSGTGFSSDENTILGRLLLNNLVLKARSRVSEDGVKPRAFYCYIDECHRFMNNDMASAIDELRQFGLRMILSHQNIGQLDRAGEHVKGAVLGSTATKVFFALSAQDAQIVSRQVYGGRLALAKYVKGTERPTIVGHRRELMAGQSRSGAEGSGYVEGSAEGVGNARSSGTVMSPEGMGMFGLGMESRELSQSRGLAESESYFTTMAKSRFYSESVSHSLTETLVPELAWMPTETVPQDVQLMEREQHLTQMRPGQCVVCLPHAISFDAVVEHVDDPVIDDDALEDAHEDHFLANPDLYLDKDELYDAINSNSVYRLDVDDDEGHGLPS